MNSETAAIHKTVADSGVVSINNQNYTVHNFLCLDVNLLQRMFELYLQELNILIFHLKFSFYGKSNRNWPREKCGQLWDFNYFSQRVWRSLQPLEANNHQNLTGNAVRNLKKCNE